MKLNTHIKIIELSIIDFNFFSKLIYETAGIVLETTKKNLVQSRLAKRLNILNLNSYKEYRRLLNKKNNAELQYFIDALCTNKTLFFREPRHFDYLKKVVLPELICKRNPVINCWSAACSTGEEAYTLGMVMYDFLKIAPEFKAKILATDISSKVLKVAKSGIYKKERRGDIPPTMYMNYCESMPNDMVGYFKIKKHIMDMLTIKLLNLRSEKLPYGRKFDFIFLRNILIYFDKRNKELILNKMLDHIQPGGYLFLGSSENILGINLRCKRVEASVYKVL